MKLQRPPRSTGAALILSLSVLLLLLLSLSGVLGLALAHRERIRKELSRDLAETEARTLLIDLKNEIAAQITKTGGFDLSRWPPSSSSVLLDAGASGSSAFFERTIRWNGVPFGAVSPDNAATPNTFSSTDFLKGIPLRKMAGFDFVGRWKPQIPPTGHIRAQTPWEISVPVSAIQVPLSIFTFYSSALTTQLDGTMNNLGRIHAEGDLIVAGPVDAGPSASSAGTLRTNTGGALLVYKQETGETRAFSSSSRSEDFQAQGHGWIFERDSNPVTLVRPLTTAELFSKTPLLFPNKETQRLKPRCELRILHSIDATGADIFTVDGGAFENTTGETQPVLRREGSVLELDLAAWPSTGKWASKIWIETNAPDITAILIKNGENLRGDLSLATALHIQIAGSFNTGTPIKGPPS